MPLSAMLAVACDEIGWTRWRRSILEDQIGDKPS
jgi:hypothetical protein